MDAPALATSKALFVWQCKNIVIGACMAAPLACAAYTLPVCFAWMRTAQL